MNIEHTVTTRSGKDIVFRAISSSDAPAAMEYINALVEEDAPILVNQKIDLEGEQAFIDDAVASQDAGTAVYIVAWDAKHIVGICQVTLGIFRESKIGTFGTSIRKEYRGDGLGKMLSAFVIDLAVKELQPRVIVLDVFGNNDRALQMYQGLGFEEYGRVRNAMSYQDTFEDLVRMCTYIV